MERWKTWFLAAILTLGWLPAAAGGEPAPAGAEKQVLAHSEVVFMYAADDAAYKAYGATFTAWGGASTAEEVKRHRDQGIRSTGAMWCLTAGARNIHENAELREATARDIEGRPIEVPWLFDHTYQGTKSYFGCTNHPAFRAHCREEARKAMSGGADGLHVDDHLGIAQAATAFGGGLCDHCIARFREYLKAKGTAEDLARAGVKSWEGFDYRGLIRKHATTREEYMKVQYKIPLMDLFVKFHLESAAEFVGELREVGEKAAGHPILLSANAWLPDKRHTAVAPRLTHVVCEVEFHAVEGTARLESALESFRKARELGKPLAATASGWDWSHVKENGAEDLVRFWIAFTYACGERFMVPHPKKQWCFNDRLGTHWYEAPVEAYAPLYRFIRENAPWLDGFEEVEGASIRAPAGVLALARRKGPSGPVVLHVVNRDYDAGAKRLRIAGNARIELPLAIAEGLGGPVRLLRPDGPPQEGKIEKTGTSAAVEIPDLRLWTLVVPASPPRQVEIQGEMKLWRKVALTFEGPETNEAAVPNPFRDYRLEVTFRHGGSGKSLTVPGHFAADGNAAETSAVSGNRWRAHFTPDREGDWTFRASFRAGEDIAMSLDPEAGRPAAFDGAAGSFRIGPNEERGDDRRAKGILRYTGEHYLRYEGSGERFLKGGADSPENFLAYGEFDGTFDADEDSGSYKGKGKFVHRYEPHVKDWRPGDPTWQGGKGKGIIGALNYLASKRVNSVYFITYNLDGGDGRDTWMWTSPDVRDRFDASKLDQWEIVFSHMDRLGIQLHVVTQETENDRALGGGPDLNPIRKLYYRELCARFSHHLALIWNLGEENNTSDGDRKEIARFLRRSDAYGHPITVHTHFGKALTFYDGLLGDPTFEAASIQGAMESAHGEVLALRKRSAGAGRKWAIFHDEQGPASHGILPDASDPYHDVPRIQELWGNLMGGGSGVEWYFGYEFPNMDIDCEDFRSRDRMWDQTRFALEFFRNHLPFWDMEPDDGLASGARDARVLAKGEDLFAVYLPRGGEASLRLGEGTYGVKWYDPRSGGPLQEGSVRSVRGPGAQAIGRPPLDPEKDWAALVKR